MVSHICEQLNGGDKEWSIIGKTDLEVQHDPELGKFFYEDDKTILKTRKGNRYISEMVFNGTKFYYEIIKTPVFDTENNLLGLVGLVNDVTEMKRLQEELRLKSITDELTGVYNRNYFNQRMSDLESLDFSALTIIICDSNNLKTINDTLGHKKGDDLLTETASIIKKVVGTTGEVMRIGGDEFVIIGLDWTEDRSPMIVKALKLEEVENTKLGFQICNSYGCVSFNKKDSSLKAAFEAAEKMMYEDKARTKANYTKYLASL